MFFKKWKKLEISLGKTKNKIFARKCYIKEVDNNIKKTFLNENHIQGDVNSKINIGLFFGNEMVSLMCLGKQRLNLGFKKSDGSEGKYELLRFCSKIHYSVVGAASKLFKYFLNKYNPIEVVSYCDRRYGVGNMYGKIGFKMSHYSKPNYFYIKGTNRDNRFKYRKSELIKLGFSPNKTEKEIMFENNIYRIYDCGCLCYKWNKIDLK